MKKLITSSLLLFTSSFFAAPAAKADLLYFMADAFDFSGPLYFDYAMIGVARNVGGEWTTTWGADDSKMYLHLYDSKNATVGSSSAAATEDQVLDNVSAYTSGSDAGRYTSVGYADVSDYKTADYKFYVETYSNDEDDPVMSCFEGEAKSYSELLKEGHIYIQGLTDSQNVSPWVVPEPSSGLLILLGAGLAAWRRRGRARRTRSARDSRAHDGSVVLVTSRARPRTACARESRALRMALASSLFLLTSSFLSAFGAADDTLVSFSTKGPDTYLDGATVRDGECYALVWTRSGASFEGLAADGSAVGTNSRVVVFAPVAKGGRCPPVLFELDAELAKNYVGGAFAVYLLDTRLASGAVGGVKSDGVPVAVNGWGAVPVDAFVPNASDREESPSSDAVGTTASTGGTSTGARIAVTSRSALPANTPRPAITAIRLVGDNVYLTVKGTLPCLKYKAVDAFVSNASDKDGSSSTDAVGTTASTGGASPAAQGAASPDEEITVIAPKKGASALYSVQRD